jgi:hypothetical protein
LRPERFACLLDIYVNNRRGTGIAGGFLNQAVGVSEACISQSGIGEALPSAVRIWKYENEFATD